jgi:hypothetical protein
VQTWAEIAGSTYAFGERLSSDDVLRNRISLMVGGLWLLVKGLELLLAGEADGTMAPADGAMELYARE